MSSPCRAQAWWLPLGSLFGYVGLAGHEVASHLVAQAIASETLSRQPQRGQMVVVLWVYLVWAYHHVVSHGCIPLLVLHSWWTPSPSRWIGGGYKPLCPEAAEGPAQWQWPCLVLSSFYPGLVGMSELYPRVRDPSRHVQEESPGDGYGERAS